MSDQQNQPILNRASGIESKSSIRHWIFAIILVGTLLTTPYAIAGNPFARLVLIFVVQPFAMWMVVDFIRVWVVQMDSEHGSGFPKI